MIGGLTYSEINNLQSDMIDSNSLTILTGSNLINPKEFMEKLRNSG